MKKLRANSFVVVTTICFLAITCGVIFYTAAQHTPRASNQQAATTPAFIPTSPPPPTAGAEPTTVDIPARNKITSRDDAVIRAGYFPPFIFGNDVYVKRFPNRELVGGAWSDQENLAIWVVAVKGKRRVGLPGWEGIADGITYFLDEETGQVIRVAAGYLEPK